jgi:hypothetical protein
MIGTRTQDVARPASYMSARGNRLGDVSPCAIPFLDAATMLIDPWIVSATMPTRFHFHLVRGHERIADPIGIELREEVLRSPAIFDVVRKIWPGTADSAEWQGWSIEVTDPEGRVVRTITLL